MRDSILGVYEDKNVDDKSMKNPSHRKTTFCIDSTIINRGCIDRLLRPKVKCVTRQGDDLIESLILSSNNPESTNVDRLQVSKEAKTKRRSNTLYKDNVNSKKNLEANLPHFSLSKSSISTNNALKHEYYRRLPKEKSKTLFNKPTYSTTSAGK